MVVPLQYPLGVGLWKMGYGVDTLQLAGGMHTIMLSYLILSPCIPSALSNLLGHGPAASAVIF